MQLLSTSMAESQSVFWELPWPSTEEERGSASYSWPHSRGQMSQDSLYLLAVCLLRHVGSTLLKLTPSMPNILVPAAMICRNGHAF